MRFTAAIIQTSLVIIRHLVLDFIEKFAAKSVTLTRIIRGEIQI